MIRKIAPNHLSVNLETALRAIVRDEYVKIGRATGAVVATFDHSQRDGERPVGAGREKYRAVFRRAIEAKDPGAKKQGRALLMTAACWARWVDTLPSRKAKAPPAPVSAVTLDDAVLDELRGRKSA